MHDPLVVAFEIRRPWPVTSRPLLTDGTPLPPHRYWPAMVTVWHREPGGRDSGEVCKHHDGGRVLNGWRFHVHHWRIQVRPLQALRRRLLTRCAWCGGRSVKRDPVNCSHSWDGPRGRWWQGEPGLYHGDCSAIDSAHSTCVCEQPVLEHDDYGQCARCQAYRAFGTTEVRLTRARELKAIPTGARQEVS